MDKGIVEILLEQVLKAAGASADPSVCNLGTELVCESRWQAVSVCYRRRSDPPRQVDEPRMLSQSWEQKMRMRFLTRINKIIRRPLPKVESHLEAEPDDPIRNDRFSPKFLIYIPLRS